MKSLGFRRTVGAILGAGAVAAVALAGVQPATAATNNCTESDGRMCLYVNSSPYGYNAEYGRNAQMPSLNHNVNGGTKYYFKAGSKGSVGTGGLVWNNAAAARNLHWDDHHFRVYSESNYRGASQTIYDPYTYNLNEGVKNENTSYRWIS